MSGLKSTGKVSEYCSNGITRPGVDVAVAGMSVAARAVVEGRYTIAGLGVWVTVLVGEGVTWVACGLVNVESVRSWRVKIIITKRMQTPTIAAQMIMAMVFSLDAFISAIIPLSSPAPFFMWAGHAANLIK